MNEWIDWFQRVLDVSIRLYFRQECDLSSVYDIPLPKAGPLWKALLPEQVDPTFDEWMVLMLALMYNPQIQISAESGTKRSIFRQKNKTKRSKNRLHTTLIKPEQKVNEDLCSGFVLS